MRADLPISRPGAVPPPPAPAKALPKGAAPTAASGGLARWRRAPWWPAAKRVATLAFFGFVIYLLATQARSIDWAHVLVSMRSYSPGTLFTAAALAAASHAVYCTYDLIGRHHTGHRLRARQVVAVGFISYAYNLNLGSLIGGIAFRYRLYSRLGLETPVISQVFAMSLLTNWLGYLFLAGSIFLFGPLELPPNWKVGSEGLQVLGGVLLALAVAYALVCGFSKRRSVRLRGQPLRLPSGRTALLQWALSSINWMIMGAVVWTLLRGQADYPSVLGVLLVAAVAGVIAHVPAGLGVLEAVFIALLSPRVAPAELLAALLAYRALYYLLPLVLATVVFVMVDVRGRRRGGASASSR